MSRRKIEKQETMSDDKKPLTSDEVKAKVLEDYGLDYEDEGQKATADKIINERLEAQKELSKAIDKKAEYRELGVKAGILDPKTFEPINKEVPEGGKELNKPNELTRDEIVLIAKGIPDDEIAVLKKIQAGEKASGNDLPLSKVLEDPVYIAFKESKEAKSKAEKAQLGASGGSGNHVNKEIKQDMPRDEHKKMVEEYLSKN